MQVTSAQFNFLVAPLKELGYQQANVFDGDFICTAKDAFPVFGMGDSVLADDTDYVVEPFNWRLFLAIAAMTMGYQYLRGEYGIAKGDMGGDRVKRGQLFQFHNADKDKVELQGIGWALAESFRKPTLEELTNYFKLNNMDQKPSVGRVVIFVLGEADKEKKINNYADVAPAIITRVFDEGSGMSNLKVLWDGPGNDWRTSVKYSEEPLPYTWHWPPRV